MERIVEYKTDGTFRGKYLVKWVAHDLDESDASSYLTRAELGRSTKDLLQDFMQE